VELPYQLSDMADDTAGLLDALGIESAHVLGVSMGGMIAQSLAIQYPERVRTLVSIMSTTGDPLVGQPHPEAMAALLVPPPQNEQEVVEQALKNWQVFGSPGFPQPDDRIAARAIAAYERGFHPAGTARQLMAVGFAPDRTPQLRRLDIPTLVIHGESDPLIDPSGGRATAAAVPGAVLWMIPGMGHDLPSAFYAEIADRVATISGL
jgi:pimeloyl-ACP methyl ester carboxylesterase